MLQSLASYLFGSSNQNQEQTVNGVETNTKFTSVEAEGDWVVVDRDSEGNSDTSSIESLDIEAECNNIDHDASTPTNLTRTFSSSSLPCASNMEESWFITPPPCFTSSGPVHMATSPLENLLIEHPSMSVYQHTTFHPRRPFNGASIHSSPLDDDDDDDDDDESLPDIVRTAFLDELDNRTFVYEEFHEIIIEREIPEPELRRRLLPRRPPRTAQELEEGRQFLKKKQAQKVKIQQACANLKRSYLDRNNKAREVNGRNRRLRRGERSQGATRSHANNNRKC